MTHPRHDIPTSTPIWLFSIALLAFVALKIPNLGLPFFWDEAGVYGKMAFEFATHDLSLHPKAIDQWLSRGHPLLFPNLIALACKLFGTSVTIAHAANFVLACTLVISMFFHLSKAFHPWVGLGATLILMAMPLFFTQSVFVLPEVALALALWWTTWSFIHKKFVLYMLAGTMAILIKEPALVWIAALFGWSIVFDRIAVYKKFLWLVPFIPFGIFLLIQKQTFGWYFFPYHTGGFDFAPKHIIANFGNFMEYLFWKQARISWAIVILFGGFLAWRKKKKPESSLFFTTKPYLAAIFVSIVYIFFSSTTFFGERYVIATLPVICSLLGYSIYYGLAGRRPLLSLVLICILVISSFPYMTSRTFTYDNDMSYMRSIQSSKKTISYMLDHSMLNQGEFHATMPIIHALSDNRFGYLPEDSTARFSTIVNKKTKYVVNVVPGTGIENPENFPLDTLAHWIDQDIKTTIYAVLPKDTINIQ
ncbi:MAG: hypothetical protein M3R25_07065 [Bacteroidota bacterium]|nr:hypothetical protein [Bacteroidota bacterium]